MLESSAMWRLSTIAVLAFLPALAESQPEADAVAEILKAGGTVIRDEKLPGKPVVRVELTACQISPKAFDKIRSLTQLQYLDL